MVVLILAGFAIGLISGVKQRANIARARADLSALANALEEFKRHYGDYPQLGDFNQASPLAPATNLANTTGLNGPNTQSVQGKLFNCLTGVYGPRATSPADRLNGPNFLDVGKFHIAGTLANTFLVPAASTPGQPPIKIEQNAGLVDPWGRFYVYYYKGTRTPANWQAPGYVLYSAGPTVATNGNQTPPIAIATGLFLATQTAEMIDNIYANL